MESLSTDRFAAKTSPGSSRTRIVIITGARRTGSTLLGRMMAGLPGVCNVGELRLVWHWGLLRNNRCGCGERFLDCPFWTAVLHRAFGPGWNEMGEETLALRSAVDRMRYAPLLAVRLAPRSIHRARVAYQGRLAALYRAIADVSGCNVIVDVSKSPSHGMLLHDLVDFDLRVLHLLRDSRAVAFSWGREKKVDPVAGVKLRRRGTTRVSVGWIASNVLAETLGLVAGNCQRLLYEELAGDPLAALRRIAELLDLPFESRLASETGLEMPAVHSVGGNAVQYQRGPVRITVDDRWMSEMGIWHRFVVTALTLPLLGRYGYFRSSPGKRVNSRTSAGIK